jgi:hypothetical protein
LGAQDGYRSTALHRSLGPDAEFRFVNVAEWASAAAFQAATSHPELLKGLWGTRRRPDVSHPFGYGAELFYWSLLAALSIFVVGGVLSVWEGIQRLLHPGDVQAGLVGFAVLGLGCLLDGTSWLTSVRQLRREATARGVRFRQHLRSTTDTAVTAVYYEDTAASSATRPPSPGSGCTSCSAPRRPMPRPGS